MALYPTEGLPIPKCLPFQAPLPKSSGLSQPRTGSLNHKVTVVYTIWFPLCLGLHYWTIMWACSKYVPFWRNPGVQNCSIRLKVGSQPEDDRKRHISLGCLGRRNELRNVSVKQEASALGPREDGGVVRSDKLQSIDRILGAKGRQILCGPSFSWQLSYPRRDVHQSGWY